MNGYIITYKKLKELIIEGNSLDPTLFGRIQELKTFSTYLEAIRQID
jgi:hypothetical protein